MRMKALNVGESVAEGAQNSKLCVRDGTASGLQDPLGRISALKILDTLQERLH